MSVSLRRLGLGLHILFTLASVGLVFLSFTIEAVTIGDIFRTVSPSVKPVVVTSSIAIIVFAYTMVTGMRGTLLTDRVQFVALSLIILVAMSALLAQVRLYTD